MGGITAACFTMLEKFDVFKLWLIIKVKYWYIQLSARLTSLGGNLPSPVDFFTSIFLRSFRIFSSVTSLKEKAVSFVLTFLISMRLG